jgi:hypothetical protein
MPAPLQVREVIRTSLTTLFQFLLLAMVARSRIKKRAAMGIREIGKKFLSRKVRQNRIRFFESPRTHRRATGRIRD